MKIQTQIPHLFLVRLKGVRVNALRRVDRGMGAIVPPPFARPQKASIVEEAPDVVAEAWVVSKVVEQSAEHTHKNMQTNHGYIRHGQSNNGHIHYGYTKHGHTNDGHIRSIA